MCQRHRLQRRENGLHQEEKVGSSFFLVFFLILQFERYKQCFGPCLDVTPQAAVTHSVL